MFKVSIIIPFKNKGRILQKCLESILKKTYFQDYEIILVNNNSTENLVKEYLNSLLCYEKIKIIEYNKAFNFSAINNFAVKYAQGNFLLFLNNDTEVISENWLEEMLKCFEDEKVGAVGAKLLYSNGTIQHVGVEMHPKHGPVHTSRLENEQDFDFNKPRVCMAVTAACMMTRKDLFKKAGGFDEENFPIAYNDVDYCLKIHELGYDIVCTPYAKLYHYESMSRKSDVFARIFNRKRYKNFLQEKKYFYKKWLV